MNQSEKKKKAILEATFELLQIKPIKAITVEEIAEKAAVSKVTLFKHFGNKKQLLNLVIRQRLDAMNAKVINIIESELNFEETYHAIIKMELESLKDFSPVFNENIMTQYSLDPDFLDRDDLEVQVSLYQKLWKKGRDEKKIADNISQEDLVFLIQTLSEGIKGHSAQALFDRTELLVQFFIRGIS